MDLRDLDRRALGNLSDEEFAHALADVLAAQADDRKETQLLYYEPNQEGARKLLASNATMIGIGAGNRAGKTDNCMARWVALATGIIPISMWDELRPKFKGPLRVRCVIESHTTTLVPIILPKLQWWSWSGLPPHGGKQGHWGWVPRMSLIDGEWSKSWSEKIRTLKVVCRNPDDHRQILGYSTVQFMSFDQDPTDFASGDFDIIHEDEPPPHAVHRENQARTMSVGGMMMLSMTWPDDPAIPVDWIFDEVYEPGLDENISRIEWIEFDTMLNPHIDLAGVEAQARDWDEVTRKVRIKGQPLRFSNRIHPLFSDHWQHWCFTCGKTTNEGDCTDCGTPAVRFIHVEKFEHDLSWPCVFVLDPHPRKPHMYLWAQVDPADDLSVIAEGAIDADPTELRDEIERMERDMGINVRMRIVDPNMARSPASAQRGVTWQDEFGAVGLTLDLADNSDVGRARVNEFLKPDRHTFRPRLRVHERCVKTAHQMKRYVWDEYRRSTDRDVKQTPKDKHDDFPSMLRYLMNAEPTFSYLHQGAPVISRPGKRIGAY